ncbi:hypothetical protein [Pseudonocardia oroxyli]|uniref:Uncharacterized protein n=1 Tax=Pseudonocardia oroxyli TaxID=366584 RepID=A0A1G7WWL9_PSEOR|nr:hypothetical protein [Pseudonocardia oroxyli]SDG76276.1 hypothetical protein SAMN05216377_1153 [Pseudonocardia oroxyli]
MNTPPADAEPLLLERRARQVDVDHGLFSFTAVGGVLADVPDDLGGPTDPPCAAAAPDALFLSSGASYQRVECSYEVWSAQPPELSRPPAQTDDSEVVTVDVLFSADRLFLWAMETFDDEIPLPTAGHYRAEVRVQGRRAAFRAYVDFTTTLANDDIHSLESWFIRFWPVTVGR